MPVAVRLAVDRQRSLMRSDCGCRARPRRRLLIRMALDHLTFLEAYFDRCIRGRGQLGRGFQMWVIYGSPIHVWHTHILPIFSVGRSNNTDLRESAILSRKDGTEETWTLPPPHF